MNLFKARHFDGERLDLGGLPIRLSVNRRARRVSLRIDRSGREAIAVAPSTRRLADAVAFARARRAWLADRLAHLAAQRLGHAAQPLALFGEPLQLVPDGRRPHLIAACGGAPTRLVGCGADEIDPQLVARAVKRRALEVFQSRVEVHCQALGVAAPPVAVMDARTRWGSCTPARVGRAASIRLSWRLALAPFVVADYVVAHECAHLLEANHGPGFWALVRGLVGDEKRHRAWLRAEGGRLHGFGC
ncbi:MAG: YgjP-like metallopeptidase domain-containing protein [Caulobacteraceae bacterium]